MKARWYLAVGLGLGVALFFLGWHSRTARTRLWETNVSPTDKPAVNFVVSLHDDGAPFLKRVILSAEEPQSGKLMTREMDFSARPIGHEKIEFVLKEDAGDLLELALPPSLGDSFKAELRSRSSGVTEELQFEGVR